MYQVKKIIFDNDGVNIDSEHLAMQVMDDFGYALVAKYVAEPIEGLSRGDIYKTFAGTSSDKIIKQLIEKYSLPLGAIKEDYKLGDILNEGVSEALSDQLTKETIDYFRENLTAISGVTKALQELANVLGGVENMALCTTSRKDRMNVSIESAVDAKTYENAGLSYFFPDDGRHRVSGYGYDNKYAYFMGLNSDWIPQETVIVEDSISGVKKAKATSQSFRVIGTVASKFYGETLKEKKGQVDRLIQSGADVVISDMTDLPMIVQWMRVGMDVEQKPHFNAPVFVSSSSKDDPRSYIAFSV